MSLDRRARRAVRGLQESVRRSAPAGIPSVARRRRISVVAVLAGLLTLGVASIAVAAILPAGPGEEPAAAPPTSSATTTTAAGSGKDVLAEGFTPAVYQVNASSAAPEPYSRFYGTMPAGTVVQAHSAYGTAESVAGSSGQFSMKVRFSGAPQGVAFPVTITAGGRDYQFEFTWLWESGSIAITAHQAHGSSTSPTPYEKVFGMAPPGTAIVASSPYGSAEGIAGELGNWSLKVWFQAAPAGESFSITVLGGAETFTFPFVSYYEAPPAVEISVSQQGTSSSAENPYTRFYGTAPEGTHLLATSAYGAAETQVGVSGEFSFKVWFSGAPAGKQFPVTFKVNQEPHATFYFTSYWTPSPVGVTVNQYNAESWDASPWVKFYGTAPVGTQVEIVSPYGSTSAATTSTNWLLKLHFSSLPPAGQQFTVTVNVNGQAWGTYPFTSWYQDEAAKTAQATYGSCSENPPYDVYYGTAPAGTGVSVTSTYGAGAATADASGNWQVKVYFSGAPLNESFNVTVSVGGKLFYFTMKVTG